MPADPPQEVVGGADDALYGSANASQERHHVSYTVIPENVRVLTVVGNRPQFIKAAAVSHRLREGADEVLVHTGQHYDEELSQIFFTELGLPRWRRCLAGIRKAKWLRCGPSEHLHLE